MLPEGIAYTKNHKKRLLLISQYFPVEAGGAEQQVYCLAKYFRARMEVHYLTVSDRSLESGDADIRISTIPKRRLLRRAFGLHHVLDYFQVMSAIRRIQPDFIYVQHATAHLKVAARYAMSSNCTLIWHIASERDVRPFRVRSLKTAPLDYLDKRRIEYGIRHAHYIFGQAKYEEELLLQNYGRTCDLIVGNWHPEPARACVKGRPVKVVWIANIKPLKQPDVFVDLADRLGHLEDVQFIMIGRPASTKYQRHLESRIKNVRNLSYLGEVPIDAVNRILDESHVFVNTSEYEGFPNTFVQAWFREVPVVSLHVDPDGVLETEGLGFHSGHFDRLVQDTQRLIEDADLRMRMGRRAKAYAARNHCLTRNLSKVAEFLQV